MSRPYFIDIDGTLTFDGKHRWGAPRTAVIAKVKAIIERGERVILWSGGGAEYAKKFAAKYGIAAEMCIDKPRAIVDDNPTIRPKNRMPILSPEQFTESDI